MYLPKCNTLYMCTRDAVIHIFIMLYSYCYYQQGVIITSLKNAFKEFRRDKDKKRAKNKVPHTAAKPKPPGRATKFLEPVIPSGMYIVQTCSAMLSNYFEPGEDELSFLRYTKALQMEYKKERPNPQIVEELMSSSFAMRRTDILNTSYDLQTLFGKYPFLNDTKQVC